MELIITILTFIFLLPVLIGWAIIGLSPLFIALLGPYVLFEMIMDRFGVKESQPQPDLVLVVDDEYQSVRPLLKLLEQAQVPFLYAKNGYEALKAFQKDQFRLIFMDVLMPQMSGVEVLEKADKEIHDGKPPVPVIFYSATSNDSALSQNPTTEPLVHLRIIGRWSKSMNILKLHASLNKLLQTSAA